MNREGFVGKAFALFITGSVVWGNLKLLPLIFDSKTTNSTQWGVALLLILFSGLVCLACWAYFAGTKKKDEPRRVHQNRKAATRPILPNDEEV